MTSPINGNVSKEFDVKNRTATSLYTQKTTTDVGQSKDVADQDTFMKLLVAQLKYQDPSKPADSTQFLAQTAQFTQVQKLGQIENLMQSQQLIGASNLVGKTITYQDANGDSQSGVVTSAKLNGDSSPILKVGNTDVELSRVTEVQNAATAAATQPTATPTTAPAVTKPAGSPPPT
jgi:flagellar basal-body rod modification protein FlgD